jgi:hypothetical protein
MTLNASLYDLVDPHEHWLSGLLKALKALKDLKTLTQLIHRPKAIQKSRSTPRAYSDPASGVDALRACGPQSAGDVPSPLSLRLRLRAGLAPLGQTCGFPRLAAAPPSLAPSARLCRAVNGLRLGPCRVSPRLLSWSLGSINSQKPGNQTRRPGYATGGKAVFRAVASFSNVGRGM